MVLMLKMAFEGETSEVGTFDMERNSFKSRNISLPSYVSAATSNIVVFNSRVAYIVQSIPTFHCSIWELDLETFEVQMVSTMLPTSIVSGPEAVSDGKNIFLVGGYEIGKYSQEGILQFEPENGVTTFLHVDNWPIKDGSNDGYNQPPKCVHVPKLNRIYYFGGQGSQIDYTDTIFYVDLNPLSHMTPPPPTTIAPRSTTPCDRVIPEDPDPGMCDQVWFGHYPHPTDCAGFIVCILGEFDLFYCPDGYYYDPRYEHCNYADQVECSMCI